MGRKKKPLPELKNINITGVAAEGKSLARVFLSPDSETPIVLFVPYGAPGDVVDIQVTRKKNSFAEGRITRIVEPSADRVSPKCPYFTVCGGCKWQHLPYPVQLYWKRQQVEDALKRIAKVDLPEIPMTLGSEEVWNYRNKMEYTFSNKKWRTSQELQSGMDFTDSSDALGFHIPGAFDKVLHIDQCFLQPPIGDKIRNFIYDFAEKNNLSFYDIRNNIGLLRTMMIRFTSTGELMVCIVFGENDQEKISFLMEKIAEKFPQITSLLYVINMKANDTIGDQEIHVFKGKDYIEEEMDGLKFRVNAKSFYQTNSRQAYTLYKIARKFAGLEFDCNVDSEVKKPLVYDLYTGAGTIANFIARGAEKVIGIEYVDAAIEDAKINSAANGITNTLFFAGDMKDILTNDFVAEHGHPDIMIIDPPRAGMHPDVVEVILNANPEIIVYVSCNPATQARDLSLLDKNYRVTDVQPVDMFPHTHHVENVIRLMKRDS